jgi:hypothetical protein
MKRFQLEHLIKAAGTIAEIKHLVVVGSQAILGSDADPDSRLIRSEEAERLEVHDLALAKLVAARPKDIEDFKLLIAGGYLRKSRLLERAQTLESTPAVITRVLQQVELHFS